MTIVCHFFRRLKRATDTQTSKPNQRRNPLFVGKAVRASVAQNANVLVNAHS